MAKFISDAEFEKNIGIAEAQPAKEGKFISDENFEKNIGVREKVKARSSKEIKDEHLKKLAERTSTGKAMLIGTGRGMMDIVQGVKQLGLKAGEKLGLADEGASQRYTDEVNKELQLYDALSTEKPYSTTIGRITGNIAATAPVGLVGAPVRGAIGRTIATGAMQGATAGALEYTPENNLISRGINSVVGGAFGAAVPGGYYGGKGLINKMIPNKNPIEVDPMIAQEAAKRAQEGKDLGVDLSAGAVTRNPTLQAKEELLLKGSDSKASDLMRNAAENTEKQIYEAGQKILSKVGGEAKDIDLAGREVQGVVRGTNRNQLDKIDEIYEIAKKAPGGNVALPADNLKNAFVNVFQDFAEVKLAPALNKLLTGVSDGSVPFDVGTANDLIKRLNHGIRSTSSKESKMALNILKDNVYDALDTIADSNNPAASLFADARKARLSLADTFSQKDIVEMIVKKKAKFTDLISPEKIVGRIKTATDWNKIENALKYKDPKTGEISQEGIAAWDNLRATRVDNLFKNATTEVNGQTRLNLTKLKNEVKALGEPVLKKLIGNEKVSQEFDKLIRVMDYWSSKAEGTINYSNSANVISRIAEKGLGLLKKIPVVGDYVDAKIFEVFREAADKRWVEHNLRIGKGEMPKAKKPVTGPTTAGNIARLIPSVMATKPSTPMEDDIY